MMLYIILYAIAGISIVLTIASTRVEYKFKGKQICGKCSRPLRSIVIDVEDCTRMDKGIALRKDRLQLVKGYCYKCGFTSDMFRIAGYKRKRWFPFNNIGVVADTVGRRGTSVYESGMDYERTTLDYSMVTAPGDIKFTDYTQLFLYLKEN